MAAAGNAAGLGFFLSPSITFKRIIVKKSTEKFSGIPYVMTLLGCLLATWYGLPFISPNNYLVAAINGGGAVIECVYVLIFVIFAPKKEKEKILALLFCTLAIFSTAALVSIFSFKQGRNRQLFCGSVATIFNIITYGSPLSVMKMVIKTKSVEYMPFPLSLLVFICCTSWFIYGLIGNDKFLYISNGIGCLLGAIQLILYAVYSKKKDDVKKPTDGNLQMGLAYAQQPNEPNFAKNGES
ncbi:Nodulin MtN3 family protein [Perilla frutescens var. frutescens]|nr:Nodulin MtN3 family protein [Perilla frutescens var. frutescens]